MSVVSFETCVWKCWEDPEFMREYRRLTGHALGQDRRAAIERLIDDTTGHVPSLDEREARAFLDFVYEYIWAPLQA
jgi:hypothetical protein